MENFKQTIKGVLRKFSDKREKTYPSIRMSDINVSATSEILTTFHCSTFKSIRSDEMRDPKNENDIKNNQKANTNSTTEISPVKMNNLIPKTHCASSPEQKDENKNKLPKLKIINNEQINTVQNLVNNFSKDQSIVEKNIYETVKTRECSPGTPRHNKPIMGKAALLKKANLERNDSLIIHELITNRYNEALNHYHSRMYQRRKSKIDSSEDEYSDTVFSSPPNCSPASVSSIETPNSITFDERNGFNFQTGGKERKDFEFLRSTDDVNIDTTAEDLDTSSFNYSAISHDKSTSFSEYDPKKFIENAIGETTNVSSESGIANDEPEAKETSRKTENSSMGPSDISSLLSRANSVYNSIKKSMKRNSLTHPTTPRHENVKDNHQSIISDNSLLDHLMRELSVQNEILFQVSKALNYCRTMKGFETSVEFIEAEKILLLASCTKTALTKEIENIEDDTYEKKDDPRSCGQVTLSNLKFFPKEEFRNGLHGELTEQFVIILTCGSAVLASEVVEADKNGVVCSEKNFEFKKLPTDFEISVCVYAMRLRSKPHHNRDQTNCPSAKKFFQKKVTKKYDVRNESLYIRASSFASWGRCEIRNPDLSKIKSNDTPPSVTLRMYNVPQSSSLSGIFSVNITSSIKLSNKMSGFLTIGLDNEHGCIIWNVRWCMLEGAVLKYWNHPSEEVTGALGSLDLNNCLEQQISIVDRSLCARPRTLMVPVRYKEGERKYLLSADKLSDMKQWEKEINYVLRALSMWKCGGATIT